MQTKNSRYDIIGMIDSNSRRGFSHKTFELGMLKEADSYTNLLEGEGG